MKFQKQHQFYGAVFHILLSLIVWTLDKAVPEMVLQSMVFAPK